MLENSLQAMLRVKAITTLFVLDSRAIPTVYVNVMLDDATVVLPSWVTDYKRLLWNLR